MQSSTHQLYLRACACDTADHGRITELAHAEMDLDDGRGASRLIRVTPREQPHH